MFSSQSFPHTHNRGAEARGGPSAALARVTMEDSGPVTAVWGGESLQSPKRPIGAAQIPARDRPCHAGRASLARRMPPRAERLSDGRGVAPSSKLGNRKMPAGCVYASKRAWNRTNVALGAVKTAGGKTEQKSLPQCLT